MKIKKYRAPIVEGWGAGPYKSVWIRAKDWVAWEEDKEKCKVGDLTKWKIVHGGILLSWNETGGIQEAKALERMGAAGWPSQKCQSALAGTVLVDRKTRVEEDEGNSYSPSLR